jgi:hypothetical protein
VMMTSLPVLATTSIRASRSCAVVMVKASKHRNSDHTGRIGPPPEHSRRRHALFEPLMRARGVEIAKAILLEDLTEVPFAENNNVVEALAPDAAEKWRANRIHERSLDRRPKNADVGAVCGTVEVGAEFASLSRMMNSDQTPKGVDVPAFSGPAEARNLPLGFRGLIGRRLARVWRWIVRFET